MTRGQEPVYGEGDRIPAGSDDKNPVDRVIVEDGMESIKTNIRLSLVLAGLALVLIGVLAVSASGAQVTSGDLETYASGLERGFEISGRVQMVRTGDGRTLVNVQAWGLEPNTTYPVHVHNAPCNVNNGGGHYQDVVGGAVDSINEIWPGFTTNVDGHGNGFAVHNFTARPEAQAVVIHDTDGARLACADLR
jgi:hypothetical protein